MFHLTSTEYGQTFYAQTFQTFDDACAFLDSLQLAQDVAYSYARECSIAELQSQIIDFMAECEEL